MNVASGHTFTFSGTNATWSGGTIQGSGGVSVAGRLAITGNDTLDTNLDDSTGVFQTAGTLSIGSGATLTVDSGGLYEIQTSGSVINGTGTFLNQGSVQKTAGGGTATVSSPFSNPGTVNQSDGTLSFSNDTADISGTTLTQGTWTVSGQNTLSLNGGSALTTIGSGAEVLLNALHATFTNFSNLADNQGDFELFGDQNFTPSGSLTESGTVTISSNSSLTLGPSQTYTMTGGFTSLDGSLTAPRRRHPERRHAGRQRHDHGQRPQRQWRPVSRSFAGHHLHQRQLHPGFQCDLRRQIQGTDPSTPDFDQIYVTGNVSLAGNLNVTLLNGFTPSDGDSFEIINNQGSNPVSGHFAGLPRGGTFTLGGKTFHITYVGGDGNDVVLTVFSTVYVVTNTNDDGAGSLRQGDHGRERQHGHRSDHLRHPRLGRAYHSATVPVAGRQRRGDDRRLQSAGRQCEHAEHRRQRRARDRPQRRERRHRS